MYSISYHSEVANDISAIGSGDKKRIKVAIEFKLMIDPVRFGKPLQHSLRGLRTFRVGDYRVVFLLIKNEIFVVMIAHRSVVYDKAVKRV